jgi:hypothetical protein
VKEVSGAHISFRVEGDFNIFLGIQIAFMIKKLEMTFRCANALFRHLLRAILYRTKEPDPCLFPLFQSKIGDKGERTAVRVVSGKARHDRKHSSRTDASIGSKSPH